MSESEFKIPKKTNAELEALVQRIQPLVRDSEKRARTIALPDLRNIAYTWAPVFKGDPVEGLRETGKFRCLHTYGYYGLFKPSIAEVLCQIPQNELEFAEYFEITKSPSSAADLNAEKAALDAGFQVSEVTLYCGRPKEAPKTVGKVVRWTAVYETVIQVDPDATETEIKEEAARIDITVKGAEYQADTWEVESIKPVE